MKRGTADEPLPERADAALAETGRLGFADIPFIPAIGDVLEKDAPLLRAVMRQLVESHGGDMTVAAGAIGVQVETLETWLSTHRQRKD